MRSSFRGIGGQYLLRGEAPKKGIAIIAVKGHLEDHIENLSKTVKRISVKATFANALIEYSEVSNKRAAHLSISHVLL